ncbi:hypothetical protein P0100_22340 [Yersinia pestis]|uniref:hypothetical protein n=1 Tax=Paenibacillus lautus TaxID=1401 RepID=UPI00256A34D2|nr:hypothetical protein [Paenibacillus lautus]MDL1163747.1 hypothetical protein [Yersinia pestis]MEC0257208.1 hypothetical protein [Paenibacillus lautus]
MLVDVFYYIKLSMSIFIFSLLITLILILLKKPVVNKYAVGMLAVVSSSVSVVNMIISGYVADEVPSGGDPITLYMFFAVLLLSIVSMILVSRKREEEVECT